MRWYYACKVRKGTVFIKGIYTSGNSRMAELVRPNIQKKIADVRAWDDIMHKVHNGIVFIKGIYSSGNSRKAELVRPNIQKKIACACMRCILHVHNGTVFIKGIYTSGNSRMAELVRRNIQNKIVDVRAWDDIMHKVRKRYCIYQRNLYFRELTHGRTGSPEHPKENSRCVHEMILCIKYTTVLYLSKESILQGTHAWPSWFARTSKRK